MAGQFDGKVALITGAGSGIGRAVSLILGEQGAKVVVADINVDGGEETVSSIKGAGGEAIFIRTDVRSSSDVQAMVNRTVETFGRLDCAFNNAGVLGSGGFTHEISEEFFDEIMSINLRGVFLCMKYEIPHMLSQGKGAIVNTSSTFGFVAMPGSLPYSASKHAVMGMTRAAALEYSSQGIRVNAICPGFTRTNMSGDSINDPAFIANTTARHPIGRIAEPPEIAAAVVWLLSDQASFVTGSPMHVDGGRLAI